MANIDLRVPDIGNFDAVDVIEINVKVGDIVAVDDTLMTLESDKASMDVPAEAAGKIVEILVKVGDQVKTGDAIARIEAVDAPAKAPAETEVKAETVAAPAKAEATAPSVSSPVQAASPSGEIAEIRIPAVGNSDELDVIDIPVKVGDSVAVDDTLATLESDKASMDVPADKAGVITEIAIAIGDKVKEGDLVVKIQAAGAAAPVASAPQADAKVEAKAEAATASPSQSSSVETLKAPHPGQEIPVAPVTNAATLDFSGAHASPSVRAFARELGANLNEVTGSGRNRRILREDVLQYVKSVLSGAAAAPGAKAGTNNVNGSGLDLLPWPKVDFTKFGEVEEKPLSRIQKISGANLARNWAMIPHVAQFDEADITDLEALRKTLNKEYEKEGARVTILAFLFKAVVKALQKFPTFNSSLEGDNLILKKYYHIGFAADTPNGLVVPVIRDCDKKGVIEIAAEMRELAGLAREGKLKPDQMTGGCFTISSLGGIGGTNFIPIINAPEVAILGVAKNQIKPVWNGKEFEPRLMIPLSLSYDHRVIDGALGARFIVYLNELLADMRRMVI